MISKNLANALEEIGFVFCQSAVSANSHSYAVYGDYLITVYELSGKKNLYINFKFSENEENSLKKYDMSETFSEYIEEYSITDYTLSEDGMRVTSTASIPSFLKLIDVCVSLLVDNQIRGVSYCSKCGNKFGSKPPKRVTYCNENHIMCEHCALETIEESNVQSAQQDVPNRKNTVLSIISAFLFSVIGIALYFVLYYWLSPALGQSSLNEVRYIFCASGFIVSALSYAGYRIFSNKGNWTAYVFVPLASILATAIGQYLGVVFEYIAKNGFTLSTLSNKHFWLVHLRNTIPADIADSFVDLSSVFYKLLAISLMFAAVGSAIFLLSLHDKSVVKKETASIETLVITQ